MTFVYDENAGVENFSLRGEQFKYLIKVRRHHVGERLGFRHPAGTDILYIYEITAIEGRSVELRLIERHASNIMSKRSLHLGWCVIDTKSIEKVLPLLNELGVAKITFIYCDRSQKNFRPDFKRFERILSASMQQCGRSKMMRFEMMDTIEDFLESHPESVVLDLCDEVFEDTSDVKDVLIGTEGGFSLRERSLFQALRVRRLDTPMVLRSETAATAISTKILL